jgi:UDP-glucose 4-epimerase
LDTTTTLIIWCTGSQTRYSEYNIGSGNGATVNRLVEIIEKKANYKLAKKHIDTPDTYIEKIVLDTSRFVSEFKLMPSVVLEEGISKTWDYVRAKD